MKTKIIVCGIIVSVALRICFAAVRPNWQAPDEFPHFYYAAHLAVHGTPPEFIPEHPYYEAFQPPLYYLLSAGIIKTAMMFTGSRAASVEEFENIRERIPEILLVRLFSVLLGVAALAVSWSVFRDCFPEQPAYADLCFLLLLAHPAFMSNTTSITNDALAVLIGVLLLAQIPGNRFLNRPWTAGLLLAAGMLVKANLLLFIPLFLIIAAGLSTARKRTAGAVLRMLLPPLAVVCSAVLLEKFHMLPYRFFPPYTGSEEPFSLFRLYQVFRNFFWSFWAAFGRTYEIHLPAVLYGIIFFPVSLLAAAGVVKSLARGGEFKKNDALLFKFLLVALVFAAASVHFSLLFFGGVNTSWGKNIFPVLPAVTALFVFGLLKIMGNRTKIVILALTGICFLIDLWALGVHAGL